MLFVAFFFFLLRATLNLSEPVPATRRPGPDAIFTGPEVTDNMLSLSLERFEFWNDELDIDFQLSDAHSPVLKGSARLQSCKTRAEEIIDGVPEKSPQDISRE